MLAMKSALIVVWCLGIGSVLVDDVNGQKPEFSAVEYAQADGRSLLLDVYETSDRKQPAPLIVWVHGGAWRAGSRTRVPVTALTKHGFTIASVDYRLSPVARFPAQVHDIKAAIRFLRSNASAYGIDPDRIAIAGNSAGGHLAALVGVTNQHKELEGDIGTANVSSDVQAIVSYYGASNLQTILSQSTPHGLSVRVPALELLLGKEVCHRLRDGDRRGDDKAAQPEANLKIAKLASPVEHVDKSDPPLLLLHGDQDPQMPINQAHELFGRYKKLNRIVEFEVIYGSAHGGPGFYTPEMTEKVANFLHKQLPKK
jgi:acetyl esterase/lipase